MWNCTTIYGISICAVNEKGTDNVFGIFSTPFGMYPLWNLLLLRDLIFLMTSSGVACKKLNSPAISVTSAVYSFMSRILEWPLNLLLALLPVLLNVSKVGHSLTFGALFRD